MLCPIEQQPVLCCKAPAVPVYRCTNGMLACSIACASWSNVSGFNLVEYPQSIEVLQHTVICLLICIIGLINVHCDLTAEVNFNSMIVTANASICSSFTVAAVDQHHHCGSIRTRSQSMRRVVAAIAVVDHLTASIVPQVLAATLLLS
jgi:hypothetical protein